MREQIWEYARALCVLISDAVLCFLVTGLIPVLGNFSFFYTPQFWMAAVGLQVLAGMILLWRGTSMTVYLLVQTAFVAAEVFLSCVSISTYDYLTDMRFLFGTVAAGLGIHAAYVAYFPPKANLVLGYVDVIVVFLAFYLYAAYSLGRSDPMLLPCSVAAMVFDLVVVSHLRVESENGHRISGASTLGKTVLLVLPVLFLILTGIAVGSAAGQIHSVVDVLLVAGGKVWAVFCAIMEVFAGILAAIIVFFMRLLPNAPAIITDQEAPAAAEEIGIAEEGSGVLPGWVLALILTLIVGGALIYALYELRNTRVSRKIRRTKKRRVVRKSFFFSSLFERLKKLAAAVSFGFTYLFHRKTPQGLLVLAERRGFLIHARREKKESPGAYVRRLAGHLPEQGSEAEGCPESLLPLAGMLDEIFYAGAAVSLTKEEYRKYASLIRQLS